MPCPPTDVERAFDCLRPRFRARARGTMLGSLLLLLFLPLAFADTPTTYVWEGNAAPDSGNSRWNEPNNWNLNSAPIVRTVGRPSDSATGLHGSLKTTPVMENPKFFRALMFSTTAGEYSLTTRGNRSVTIGEGGAIGESANAQKRATQANTSESQTWNANVGVLVPRGHGDLGEDNLSFAEPKSVTSANRLGGHENISKPGVGDLIPAGQPANTYSGYAGRATRNDDKSVVAKASMWGSRTLMANAEMPAIESYQQPGGTLRLTSGDSHGSALTLAASAHDLPSSFASAQLGGGGALVKSSPDKATLTIPSNFGGDTFITGGSLAVNNRTGSGTGAGDVFIQNGGTLLGDGSIAGKVVNQSGGSLSAGDAVGRLVTGTEFWQGGSTFVWEIRDATGAPGIGYDLLDIRGTLHINGSANDPVTLKVVSFTLGGLLGPAANFNPAQSYLWKIAETTGGIKFANGEDESSALKLALGEFANSVNDGTFALTTEDNGQDLALTYTPAVSVPEPGILALSALCFCGYLYGRRWRQHWRSSSRRQAKL